MKVFELLFVDATCVTTSDAGWAGMGVFMWSSCAFVAGVKTGRNLYGDRQTPP